jgi:hypothetical protein
VDTPWPAPVAPAVAAPEPPPFVDTLDAYTGAAETPVAETSMTATPEPEIATPVLETPEPEIATPADEPSLIGSLDWYAKSAAPVDDEPIASVHEEPASSEPLAEPALTRPFIALAVEGLDGASSGEDDDHVEAAVEETPWLAPPAPAIEPEPARVEVPEATKPWFDKPVDAPEPTVEDHHDVVEDDLPEDPIAADNDDDAFGAQPWSDLPPEFPSYDSTPSPSPWTDDTPVADLPRAYEPAPVYEPAPAPAPAPWVEAPAASAMPHPYETAAEPWTDAPAPAAAFSAPFDTVTPHEAWTDAPAHVTWLDAPAAAVAVDTLVEPPSIDTSIPEPPERFSGAPPMPPGMRAPGPTPGEPVTPESFMDPRVSFKRRHPVRRLLLVVLVLGLAAGGGYWWVNHNKPNPTAASAAAFLEGDGTVSQPPGTHFRVRFPTPGATVANPKQAMVGPGGATVTVAQHLSIASTSGFGMSVREIDYASAVPASQADSLLGGVARHLDGPLAPSVTYAHAVVGGHPAIRTFAHIKVGGLERRELYLLVDRRLFVVSVNAKQHDKELFAAVVKSFKTT